MPALRSCGVDGITMICRRGAVRAFRPNVTRADCHVWLAAYDVQARSVCREEVERIAWILIA